MDTINQEIHIVNVEILFNDLLTMPYFRNYAATSGNVHNISNHESAVESVSAKIILHRYYQKILNNYINKQRISKKCHKR